MEFEFEFEMPPDGPTEGPGLDKIVSEDEVGEHIAKQAPLVRITYDLCEETGVCAEVCPESVLESRGGHTTVVNPEACTECWICVENCVSGAIEVG
jgi:NAD-dependent dihydropyrimidine dehydrogenase PreA subunit